MTENSQMLIILNTNDTVANEVRGGRKVCAYDLDVVSVYDSTKTISQIIKELMMLQINENK